MKNNPLPPVIYKMSVFVPPGVPKKFHLLLRVELKNTINPPKPPSPSPHPLPEAINHDVSSLFCTRFLLHFSQGRSRTITELFEKRCLTTLMRKVKNGNL